MLIHTYLNIKYLETYRYRQQFNTIFVTPKNIVYLFSNVISLIIFYVEINFNLVIIILTVLTFDENET